MLPGKRQPLGRAGGPVNRQPLGRQGEAVYQNIQAAAPSDPMGGGEWFAVEVTEVTGTGGSAVYSFTEIQTVAGVGGTEERTSARVCDKDVNPARSLDSGTTFTVGQPALARRSVSDVNAFELAPISAGITSDWKIYKITARTGAVVPDTPPLYEGVEVELAQDVDVGDGGDQIGWVNKPGGDTFDQGIRAPSKDRDEDRLNEILIPIPVGQVVLARPSTSLPGYYEITPWGGLKRTILEHIYRVCAVCEDVGGGMFKIRVKMAIRKIAEDGRDRRALWLEATETEQNLEDNTDLSIDPDPSTDI